MRFFDCNFLKTVIIKPLHKNLVFVDRQTSKNKSLAMYREAIDLQLR